MLNTRPGRVLGTTSLVGGAAALPQTNSQFQLLAAVMLLTGGLVLTSSLIRWAVIKWLNSQY